MKNYSIIIPHKNISLLLERCLRSIPQRRDVEIIVVDDNSCKEEVENITKLQSDSTIPSFLFIQTTEGKGAGYARNNGVEHANGNWIIFADADDYFTEQFDAILDEFKDNTSDAIYFKTQCRMTDDAQIQGPRQKLCDGWSSIIDHIIRGEEKIDTLLIEMVVPWGKFIKRQFLLNNGITFEEIPFANDVMWSTQVAVRINPEKFVVSEKNLYTLTERKDSLFNTKNSATFLYRLKVYIRQEKLLRSVNKCMTINYVYYFNEANKISFITLCKTMWIALYYTDFVPPVLEIEKKLNLRYPILYMLLLLVHAIKTRIQSIWSNK